MSNMPTEAKDAWDALMQVPGALVAYSPYILPYMVVDYLSKKLEQSTPETDSQFADDLLKSGACAIGDIARAALWTPPFTYPSYGMMSGGSSSMMMRDCYAGSWARGSSGIPGAPPNTNRVAGGY